MFFVKCFLKKKEDFLLLCDCRSSSGAAAGAGAGASRVRDARLAIAFRRQRHQAKKYFHAGRHGPGQNKARGLAHDHVVLDMRNVYGEPAV